MNEDTPKQLIERGFFPATIDLTEDAWAAIGQEVSLDAGLKVDFWLRTQPRVGESFMFSTGLRNDRDQKFWRGQIVSVLHIPYKIGAIDDKKTEDEVLTSPILSVLLDDVIPASHPDDSSPWVSE